MKFVVTCISEDTPSHSISGEIETDCWFETFPVYLAALRGAGYTISEDIALTGHTLSERLYGNKEYLFPFPTETEHAECYYDTARNK